MIKAKKNYKCDYCQEDILKGDLYNLVKSRYPRYSEKGKQVGIEYVTSRTHYDYINCNKIALEKNIIDLLPYDL